MPLSEPFLAGLRALGRPAPAASAELEATLAAAFEAGRAAWPQVLLAPEELVRALAERLDPDEEPLTALARVRAADLFLTTACARGDARALRLFDEQFLARVPALVRRLDASGALGAEVAQDLRDKLLMPAERGPRIADYSGRGDLLGWLRVVALRTALKLRRSQQRQGVGELSSGGAELLDRADPERDYLRLRYRGEYEAAFHQALAALTAPERLLLKLHYADALSLERLAALHKIHRATVARRLADHRRKLLDTTRALLRERLKLTDSEFESVLALVRSQLAISVRSALS